MRFHKFAALFKLGMEDLTKNMSVFVYVLIPLALAFLYSGMMEGAPVEMLFFICVLMNLAMIPIVLMGTIIAEEKEKNTLRTLLLNDVRAVEVLGAKAVICLIFVILDNILMYFILGVDTAKFAQYQLVGLFVALAVILFGAFVGLFAKNQMSASLIAMPFMFLFLAPMFIRMLDNEVANKVSQFLPTDAMLTIFYSIYEDTVSAAKIAMPLVVIAAWLVLSVVMFYVAYKKVGVDN